MLAFDRPLPARHPAWFLNLSAKPEVDVNRSLRLDRVELVIYEVDMR